MKTRSHFLRPDERLAPERDEDRDDHADRAVDSGLQSKGSTMLPYARASAQAGGATSAAALRPGTMIGGAYRVDRIVRASAMDTVVDATHIEEGQRVAIKVLRPEAARRADVAARFLREARAAERLKGEHTARVVEVGTLESGAPYMATEYLEGIDLRTLLRDRGPLPLPALVDVGLQLCEALAEPHAAGVVHRNLTPEKVFLSARKSGAPVVKVLGFGITNINALDPCANGTFTAGDSLPSSPLYLAPEQLRDATQADTRADIWALGVILFELASGSPPFHAQTALDLAVAITREPPRSLRGSHPELPKDLEKLVLRCLEKDPSKRFARVSDVAAALRKLVRTR